MRLDEINNDHNWYAKQIADKLHKHAHPFFSVFPPNEFIKKPLFRGTYALENHPSIELFFHSYSRQPRDTNPRMHKIADNWFLEKFGIMFRSNATFATPLRSAALTYGIPTILVPNGNFSYCWSPKIPDMTDAISPTAIANAFIEYNHMDKQHMFRRKEVFNQMTQPQIVFHVNQILENGDYHYNHGISNTTMSEVMLHCPNGYWLYHEKFHKAVMDLMLDMS